MDFAAGAIFGTTRKWCSKSEVRSGGGLWLAEDATAVKGIGGPVLQAGRGDATVSERSALLSASLARVFE